MKRLCLQPANVPWQLRVQDLDFEFQLVVVPQQKD